MMVKVLVLFAVVLSLSACTGSGNQDLRDYISEVKKKPKGAIEPIPTFRPYEAFTYGAANLRSPFEKPVAEIERVYIEANENVSPDLNREKEVLENFNMASLSVVGTLAQSGVMWALIEDSDGELHRVASGNYLGKNHGRVVNVDSSGVEVLEIVSNGRDGWVERPKTLPLKEKDE